MNKTTKRFIGLLVVLAILGSFFYYISSGKLNVGKTQNIILAKKDGVEKIVLQDSQKTIMLAKKNNVWSADVGGNIDNQKIYTLIELVLNTQKDDLISTNKEKQSQFGFGSKKIEVYVGKQKTVINLGKNIGGNVYFKINEEDKTYLTSSQFDDYFSSEYLTVKTENPTPVPVK